MSERVLTVCEAAAVISLSPRQLKRMAARGDGPPRVRLSLRRIGYRLCDLTQWLETRREIREAHGKPQTGR